MSKWSSWPELTKDTKTRGGFLSGFFSGFSRDYFGTFKSQSRFPGFRDFRDFVLGIFSGFFRGYKSPIPIPGILGFSGFFFRDFFGIFGIFWSSLKLKIPIPNPRDRDSGSRKNPIPMPTLILERWGLLWKMTSENDYELILLVLIRKILIFES